MRTRKYYASEEPRVGDVVELFEGAYGSGIVTEVRDGGATVERVHCFVSGGQLQMGVERVGLTVDRLRELPVFVTGPALGLQNNSRSSF